METPVHHQLRSNRHLHSPGSTAWTERNAYLLPSTHNPELPWKHVTGHGLSSRHCKAKTVAIPRKSTSFRTVKMRNASAFRT